MLVFGLLLVLFLAVFAVLLLMLRSVTRAEQHTDEELHKPGAPVLHYAIPRGQDAAVLVGGLSKAGFTSVAQMQDGQEVLLVECLHTEDRARVREVLEHVGESDSEFAPMRLGKVQFADE